MKINRRQFALGSAALALSPTAFAQGLFRVPDGVKYRSALLHLGMNMWGGYRAPGESVDPDLKYGKRRCLFDEGVWRRMTALMQKRRFNHAVIDLGGGVELQSHHELTLSGSFTPQQMRDEVARLSSMGIEAVPKLNFSACHDAWLGIYERMLSTPKYYRVVEDVIADACEMFGNPRTFHIGLDEEDGVHGAKDPVMAVRCGELWWHDFEFLLKTVERHGAQPIFFSGSAWYRNKEEFFRRVPKSVILNAGSYGSFTSKEEWLGRLRQEYGKIPRLKQKMNMPFQFREYADRGYRLLTCVSNWVNVADKTKYPNIEFGEKYPRNRESIACVQRYIASEMPDANIVGGMVAPWTRLDQKHEDYWRDAINNLADSCEELGWKS